MARGLRSPAASVIRHVEAGVISGTGYLIRPHPKPAPGGPQGLARLIGLHLGGVARSRSRGRLERIQDPNLTVLQVRRTLYYPPRAARFEGDM